MLLYYIIRVFPLTALISLIIYTPFYMYIAMSKTSHIKHLCGIARHGKPPYHSKFIETISPDWYN